MIDEATPHLFEFQLHGGGVHARDRVRHVLSDPKGLLLRLAPEVDEERVSVAIYDPCAPPLRGIDDANSLTHA